MPEAATYDEVAEWWETSEWNMSTYPPSAWHAYCELHGISIAKLRSNPAALEDGVQELYSEGDGRTCDCQWAGHEAGCTWSPHPGHVGHWSGATEFWICETCKESSDD